MKFYVRRFVDRLMISLTILSFEITVILAKR